MYSHHNKLIIPALIATISLIGCGDGTVTPGGGSGKPTPKAGDTYTTTILVNDKPVHETSYMTYGVADDNGKLTDQALPNASEEAQRPHVLIKQSISTLAKVEKNGTVINFAEGPKMRPPVMDKAKIENCYSNIWAKLKEAKPDASRQEIALSIAQFGVSINDLCGYAAASGMSLDEYVALFQTVTKYYPGRPNIEADMVRFFVVLNVPPKVFLTALSKRGYTWENFVYKLAANKGDGTQFINGFTPSGLSLEQYIGDYMSRPTPMAAAINSNLKLFSAYLAKDVTPGFLALMSPPRIVAQEAATKTSIKDTVDGWIDTAGSAIDTVDKGLAVGKKVWDFLRDNVAVATMSENGKPADVSTSILSGTDTATINYAYAKSSTSPVVSFVGKQLIGEAYRIDLMLDADYDARNASAPGQWLPNINVKLKNIKADYGYTLNGVAKVSNTVNRGSAEAPIPEAQIEVIVSAKNWSISQQSFTFVANGATGASVK